jgi:hopene-associated glycosyltransferase HpnB
MILFGLSLLCLIIWIWLCLWRFRAFDPPPRLPALAPQTRAPAAVAIIPARDEAASIGAVIAAHAACDYAGSFTIILVDDASTDGTAAIAANAALREGFIKMADLQTYTRLSDRRRLVIAKAPDLAPGWTGKLWAVQAGLGYADKIAPEAEYVLLTDADIVLGPHTLSALITHAQANNLALASLMARLDARGFWGGLLIPAFVYFFQKLYPFHRANMSTDKLAAAAGGCMLLKRGALDAIGGVTSIRSELIDDCALAHAIKNADGDIWIGLAKNEAISLRDNRSLNSVWEMVSRTAFTQLHHSWVLLIGSVAGMILVYLAPPAIALTTPWHLNAAAGAIAAAAWALMAFSYLPTAANYDQMRWKIFFLPVAAVFYSAMTVSSGLRHLAGRGGRWKGRSYAA